jgi:acetyl-CoA carboxylase carboxyltransferase component
MNTLRSPLHALLVQWRTEPGCLVHAGEVVAIVESMKMEHEVTAPCNARVGELRFKPGEEVPQGAVLMTLEPAVASGREAEQVAASELDVVRENVPDQAVRPDLQKFLDRLACTEDCHRPDAMARRHALGLRSGRENVADLCDDGSFTEYGALAVAAQRRRRSLEELVAQTPADGVITGLGSINGRKFGPEGARAAVIAYDPTVLAGTQGKRGHQKVVRLLDVAWRHRLPLVLFAEGGGGRPGDDDMPVVAGLDMMTFSSFARLNGHVPTVGIAAGRCFAGNASLLGCCDVIIATRGSNIGMGGPAMVEGGGLGSFRPEQIGPAHTQHANGVIDVLVDDEAHAVKVARHYLAFFQGTWPHWTAPDSQALRDVVPQNRLRAYDSRAAMVGLVDVGSLLELRSGFGRSIHTALGRIEGRPVGLLVSNTKHLGGAIDADAADKAARFMRLCSNYGIPLSAWSTHPDS